MFAHGSCMQRKSFKCFLIELSLKIKQNLKGQIGSIQHCEQLSTQMQQVCLCQRKKERDIFPIPLSFFIL